MSIVIGLDIGGSTTKIVGLEDGRLISKERVKASDPVASAFGALGKFLSQNNLDLKSIERVMMTGVGALLVARAFELYKIANVTAALSVDALMGTPVAFSPLISRVRRFYLQSRFIRLKRPFEKPLNIRKLKPVFLSWKL